MASPSHHRRSLGISPFRMSARVGGSSVPVSVCFGCVPFVLVVRCLIWLCDVCFGGAMFVLVVRCMFWWCDVCFGSAMVVLVVRWQGLGFLSACLLVFTAAVPLGSVLCLFHLFFLFGSPCLCCGCAFCGGSPYLPL